MQELKFELTVGDVVHLGLYTVTVIDIEGPEVSFRVDCDERSETGFDIDGCSDHSPK